VIDRSLTTVTIDGKSGWYIRPMEKLLVRCISGFPPFISRMMGVKVAHQLTSTNCCTCCSQRMSAIANESQAIAIWAKKQQHIHSPERTFYFQSGKSNI
jgi:predicted transcriptional regulator